MAYLKSKKGRSFNPPKNMKTTRFLDFVSTYLPIHLTATAHKNLHWAAIRKIYKVQEMWVKSGLNAQIEDITIPAKITLTRIAPRELDYDNLVTSFKHIRDVVASLLIPGLAPGRADGDKRLTWVYEQTKADPKEYAVQIEIKQVR